jgi:PPM family protein phosphatase
MNYSQILEIASCTDPGMVRSHNEDSIASDPVNGLVVLADGMGGYNAGEVASGMATTVITTEIQQLLTKVQPFQIDQETKTPMAGRMIREQVLKANTSIYQAAQSQPQYAGMGTTLVVCLFYDNKMTVGHLGDSRLYLLRDGKFSQVTRDHSLLQEQIDSGMLTQEQAKYSLNKNLVTRALGIEAVVPPDISEYRIEAEDIYVLCSDGLTDMVDAEAVREIVATKRSDLAEAAAELIDVANQNGGRDNVSVVLVRVPEDFLPTGGWLQRWMAKKPT